MRRGRVAPAARMPALLTVAFGAATLILDLAQPSDALVLVTGLAGALCAFAAARSIKRR